MANAEMQSDPVAAEWEIWYQDTFDRECPRRVEASGQGLADGLIALWARHLFETVQVDGGKGFSHFNLWWKQERKSITIVGPWPGIVQLRRWIYGETGRAGLASPEKLGQALLRQVAVAHQHLLLDGKTSREILVAAERARDREAFEARLSRIV